MFVTQSKLLVKVNPKVPATSLKQDVKQNTPKVLNQLNRQYSCFPKQPNAPRDTVDIAIGLGKRLVPNLYPIIEGNTLRSKAG